MNITRDQLEAYGKEDLIDLVHVIEKLINDKTRSEITDLTKDILPLYKAAEENYFSYMYAYSAATHPSMKRKYEQELNSARDDYEKIGYQLRIIRESRPMVSFFNSNYIGPIG